MNYVADITGKGRGGPRAGVLSLCSGTGMLDLGVKLAWERVTGGWPRVLGYAEREAYAASLLLARMEEQSLERAPVFCGDFRELDARPLRGCDILAAGLPCQPYSSAGKRGGIKDERSYGRGGDGPLPHALRIIGECEPAVVCLENVPQWVTGGAFRQFGAALCAMGYEIEEPFFCRASDVGTHAEVTSSGAQETGWWLRRQRQLLRSFFPD